MTWLWVWVFGVWGIFLGTLFKAIRYSSLGVFFAGIFTVIQGCDAKEGALAAVLLVLLQFCSGPVNTADNSFDIQLVFGPGGASVSSIITFTLNSPNSSSEELTGLLWDFGDGSTASGATVTHSYAAAGDYLVTVSLSTSNSFTASAAAQQVNAFILSTALTIVPTEEMLQFIREARPIYVGGAQGCIARILTNLSPTHESVGLSPVKLLSPQINDVGSNRQVCLTGTPIKDLAIDNTNNHIYFSQSGITRIDLLNGNNKKRLISSGNINGIALDLCDLSGGNKVYWAEHDRYLIGQANLDGSDREIIIGDAIPSIAGNAEAVRPIDIAFDFLHVYMYWTEGAASTFSTPLNTGSIKRSRPDGTEIETIVSGLDGPHEILLNVAAGKIYWANVVASPFRIWQANLDGSSPSIFATLDPFALNGFAIDRSANTMFAASQSTDTYRVLDLGSSNIIEDFSTPLPLLQMFPISLAIDDLGDIECDRP